MPENKVKGASRRNCVYLVSKYVFAEFIISGFCIDISAELNAALGLPPPNERTSQWWQFPPHQTFGIMDRCRRPDKNTRFLGAIVLQ